MLLLAALVGGFGTALWMRQRLAQTAALQAQEAELWGTWRAQVEKRLAERREPDWTPVLQRLGALEKAIGNVRLPTPEPTNLRPVLDALASIRLPVPPAVNLDPLHTRLLGLEDAIRLQGAPAANRGGDLSGVLARLTEIEQHLARLRNAG